MNDELTQEEENNVAAMLRLLLPKNTHYALLYRADETSGKLISNMKGEHLRKVLESFLADGEYVRTIKTGCS